MAIITAALIIAQPIHSNAPQLPSNNERVFEPPEFSPNETETLASSSIFPVFIAHKLPVANMADVAADIVIESQKNESEAVDRSPSYIERTPDNSAVNVQRLENDTTRTQTSAINVNLSSSMRSNSRVAALQQAHPRKSDKQLVDMSGVVSEQTTVRGLLTPELNSLIKWPYNEADQHRKTSTAHSHLYDFKAMLNPLGFQRGNWQNISHDVDLGASGAIITPFIVMIDPGHGGIDPGSKGHNGLLEKDLTLDIARRVRLFLTEVPNIDVRLTRHHDHGLSRQSRVDAIRRSEADMVISLHFNHLPQTDVNLVESYYAGIQNIKQSLLAQNETTAGELQRTGSSSNSTDLSFTEGSARLAKTLQQHIYSEVSFGNDQVQNAGVKQETLFVLTRSYKPAALIEISCLSHADEADRLASDEYRNRLAASLVDGIRNYYDSIQRVPLKKHGNLGA